jgi:hypothetical protein
LYVSRPPGVVVSIASVKLRKPIPATFEVLHKLDEVKKASPQPIETPDADRVPGADELQSLLQSRSIITGTRYRVGKELLTACCYEGIDL